MRYDSTLAAYVLLTLLVFWAVADRWAPYRGQASDCRVAYVYDGDTVDMRCGTESHSARLVGFDAPETKEPRCAAEAALGRQATERLRGLVRSGPVQIFRQGFDKYGRALIVLTVAGKDVADVMVAEGLARPYHGGARGGWCG